MENQRVVVTWKGWISLFLFILLFSGLMPFIGDRVQALSWLSSLDFTKLIGRMGLDMVNGKVSFGASRGFMEAFVLFPIVMLALGFIRIFEYYGAMESAEKIFHPFLKTLMGIPGNTGMALVASINCSDVAAVMTRKLREDKQITEDERTIFVAFQYPSTSTIINTFGAGGALLPITVLAPGVVVGIQFVAKIIGANIVRLILFITNKNKKKVV